MNRGPEPASCDALPNLRRKRRRDNADKCGIAVPYLKGGIVNGKQMKSKLVAIALLAAAAACDQSLPPRHAETAEIAESVGQPATEVTEEPVELTPHQVRVTDLTTIKGALEAYHTDNGNYPSTNDNWASVGHRKANNWFPELVPTYLETVPQDPSRSWNPEEPQYLYKSDGTGFKLIAHKSGDCSEVTAESAVQKDPKRSNPKTCWAYGFWTADYSDK